MRIATVLRQFMFVGAALCAGASALIVATQSALAQSADDSILGRPAVPGLQAPRAAPTKPGGLQLLTPPPPAWITPGTPVNITWTGQSTNVNLYLVDVDAWVSTAPPVALNIPNSGAHTTTIATSKPCNRRYLFYINEASSPMTNYSFGPVFRLKCDIGILKERPSLTTYKFTIKNGPSPISSLPSSLPEFVLTDTLPVGITVKAPVSFTGPGTWSPITLPITGLNNFTLKFKLNTGTTIPANAIIATYTMTLEHTWPPNKVIETLNVSGTPWQDSNTANNTSICN
jgi:hypothetical protein